MRVQLTCDICGKQFERYPSQVKVAKANYCSVPCARAGKRNLATLRCDHCGKEFQRHPSELSPNGNYCSKECAYEQTRSKRVKVNCVVCGKEVECSPSAAKRRRYCSRSCANASRSTAPTLTCPTCGKQFKRKVGEVKETSYCSRECSYEGRTLAETLNCATCGKEVRRAPNRVRRNDSGNFYCSRSCAHEAEHSEDTRAKRSVSVSKHHETTKDYRSTIELKVEDILDSWGLDYHTQKHFQSPDDYPEGSFGINCDFYIPELRTVIECNGTYWHADPAVYAPEDLNETQQHRLALYQRKERLLEHMGIQLVELWERDNDRAEEVLRAQVPLTLDADPEECEASSE